MATKYKDVAIVSAEPTGHGIVIYFSDGTTIFFKTHFLYEVQDHDGNVALSDMSDEDLIKGFDD